jgi:hypothetical protein
MTEEKPKKPAKKPAKRKTKPKVDLPVTTIIDPEILEILKKPYEQRTLEEIQLALQAPTPDALIEWRGQNVREISKNQFNALALAYVDARFMQNRLDEVCGIFNWQSQVRSEGRLLVLAIGVRTPKTGEWVWKWDTGQEKAGELEDPTGFGGSKGLYSTSFKRACYQWGIARDLYSLPKPRMRCNAYLNKKTQKWQFTGWVDQPTQKEAESKETGRPHKTQVDDVTDHMPASSTTFFTIAYTTMKLDNDQALQVLSDYKDQGTGEIDYHGAIIALEKNLQPDQRHYTKQEIAAKAEQ